MYRQGNKSAHRARPSLESALEQNQGRPFCSNCQRFFKHKETVWIGRRQSRCPVCGELLDRRANTMNQSFETSRNSSLR